MRSIPCWFIEPAFTYGQRNREVFMHDRSLVLRTLLLTAILGALLMLAASTCLGEDEDIVLDSENDDTLDDNSDPPCAVGVDTPIFRNVTVAQADSLIKANTGVRCFALLDVRTQSEYDQGHIAGAVKYDFNSGEFQSILDILDRHTAYLVYCRSGGRSAKAATLMRDRGFTAVYNMLGGFNDWTAAGLPGEK